MKISRKLFFLLSSLIFIFAFCGVVASAEQETVQFCGNTGCNNAVCVWVEDGRDVCYVTYGLRCPVCNSRYDIRYAYDHDFQEYSRIDPTCKTEGRANYACETDGCFATTYEILPIAPDAHNYSGWVTEVPASCNKEGSKYRVCTNCAVNDDGTQDYCDYKETQVIPFDDNAHIFDGEWARVTAPTCEAAGEEKTVCTVCNVKETTREIPAHTDTLSEDMYQIITSPSCIREGSMKCVCTKCNANVVVALPISEDHSWVIKETTSAECEKEGEKVYACMWHNDITKTEILPATGHSFTNYVSDGNATCKDDGTKTAKCDNCVKKDTITDENSKTDHIVGGWIITGGSCAENGEIKAHKVCSYCKQEMVAETTFPAGSHPNRNTVTLPASCLTDGYVADMCTDCGKVWSKTVIPAAHAYADEWTVAKAASCADEGLKTKKCVKCGLVKEEVIEKLPHAYLVNKEGLDATCLEAGYTPELLCMNCFHLEESVVIPSLGHIDTDNNGNCNRCYVYFIETENGTVDCKCIGHNPDGLAKFVFRIMVFFYKIFGINQTCECGAVHY